MIKPIMKDVLFLNQPSEKATRADMAVAQDLLDTLEAHKEGCVGLAANMIGIKKCVIAINMTVVNVAMFNPVITKKSGPYEAIEGCLSLVGERKTTRYKTIEIQYEDTSFNKQKATYTGRIAQIIQHEIDHCNGIII